MELLVWAAAGKLDMLVNALIVDIITEYIMTHPIITNDFIDHLLKAPDRELDACTFNFISKWKEYVDSVDILYVLDICARYSLASGFMIQTLDLLLQESAKLEGKPLIDVYLEAECWRNGNNHEQEYIKNRTERIKKFSC